MTAPTAEAVRLRARLDEHRDAVNSTLHRYGASNPRVFGSVARGTATTDSDIDLLIDLERDLGLFTLARLEQELSDILGAPIEVVPSKALREHLKSPVLSEAVPL